MKVIFITNLWPTAKQPYLGTFVKNSADALRAHGCAVEIINLHRGTSLAISYARFYISALSKFLTSRNCIFYVHYVSHSLPPLLLAPILRFLGNKVVIHFHGSDAFPEGHERTIRRALKLVIRFVALKTVDLIVTPSNYFKTQLQSVSAATAPIVVSPSGGVNLQILPKVKMPRLRRIIFAGRLIPGKGGGLAAHAMNCIAGSTPDWTGVIIGDGPELASIKSTVTSDRIEFLPLMDQKDLFLEMTRSSIALFPSTRRGESLGLVLVEAMLCGAVPLTLRNGAVAEIIPAEMHDSLIADSSLEFTDKAIALCTLGAPKLAEISATLQATCIEHFSSELVAQRLISHFRSI